jgi:hypothetical protein
VLEMAITLLANQCPAIQTFSDFLSIKASLDNPNAPGAETDSSVQFANNTLFPHATRLDLLARGGGANACAIIAGSNNYNELMLQSSTTPLYLLVKAGQALIGTIVELSQDIMWQVPAGHTGAGGDRIWVWLRQSGILVNTIGSAPPPSGYNCLLGSCTTDGSSVTGIDFSGVLYLNGAGLFRQSADQGMATDTPSPNVHFTQQTAFATYIWSGSKYLIQGIPLVMADPANPQLGDVWYRTDTNVVKYRGVGGNFGLTMAPA